MPAASSSTTATNSIVPYLHCLVPAAVVAVVAVVVSVGAVVLRVVAARRAVGRPPVAQRVGQRGGLGRAGALVLHHHLGGGAQKREGHTGERKDIALQYMYDSTAGAVRSSCTTT